MYLNFEEILWSISLVFTHKERYSSPTTPYSKFDTWDCVFFWLNHLVSRAIMISINSDSTRVVFAKSNSYSGEDLILTFEMTLITSVDMRLCVTFTILFSMCQTKSFMRLCIWHLLWAPCNSHIIIRVGAFKRVLDFASRIEAEFEQVKSVATMASNFG